MPLYTGGAALGKAAQPRQRRRAEKKAAVPFGTAANVSTDLFELKLLRLTASPSRP
jgi:hypothetical protein